MRRIAGLGLGLASVAALVVFRAMGRQPVTEGLSETENRIVVLPFNFSGSEELQHLGSGIASLLSTVLDGVGDLKTVDPTAVMGVVAQVEGDATPPEQVEADVERLGGRGYIAGSIQEFGGRLTISASFYELGRDPPEVHRETVDGDADTEFFRLVNDLALRMLAGLGIGAVPESIESISTTSVVALNEYLRGETALDHGDYLSAVASFREALVADSLFALGWYRLAYAVQFTEGAREIVVPARRALSLSHLLSERDRRLAEALLAAAESEAATTDRLYREILADYPNDVEALFGLADARLHFGPLQGWPMDLLGADFDRVLRLSANHPEALVHRPWAAGIDGDLAALRRSVDQLDALDPEGYFALIFDVMRASADGDSLGLTTASARLPDDLSRLLALGMVSTWRDLEAAERLTAALLNDPARLPEVRGLGHIIRAHLFLGSGKWSAALDQLTQAEALDHASALEDRALLMLMPFSPVTDAELITLRNELEGWDVGNVPLSESGNPWLVPHEGSHAEIRWYLLGAVNARLGEMGAAEGYADALSVRGPEESSGSIPSTLARNLRSLMAFESGDPGLAVRILEEPGLHGADARTWERAYSSPFFSESLERFLRAGALADLGRDEEALNFYSGIWMSNLLDLSYLAPAHLAQAELYERRGEVQEAVDHYQRFVELWSGADPDLIDRVEATREKLRTLEASRGPR